MNKSKLAYIYISFAILGWASTAAVVKLLVQELSNLQVIFYSFIFSVISLFGIVLFQKKLHLLKQYSKKDYLKMMGLGTLGCFIYFILFFGAFMYASAQEVFIINYLWPIMVVMFAIIILKERLSPLKILGILLGFFGVYIVATQGNLLSFSFTNLKADVLAILGAVSYGLFSVLGKKYNYERFTSMLIYYITGFILITITVFFFSSFPKLTFLQLIGIVWLGIFSNALPYVFWFKALEYGDTSRMANLIFLTPFLSLVYIYILLTEKILLASFIGLAAIVAGILVQSFRNKS